MTIGSFKVGRREYVIVPRKEYERFSTKLEQDARDVKKAKAALAHYRKTGRGISLDKLKQDLER
jgi:hypothetical protein